ncbi:hypothetical protein [uncultured Winogradskyella sp.]|uniref:hypothetical protein n=1 Tax=uncultured Winogradskyella sp. TaxID=395353 RepID=UPI0026202903|nr:hypothetical protein [uncultured Winogradskyella sp.]
MKKISLIILFLSSVNLFAQQDIALTKKIENIENQLKLQQTDIQKLYSELNKEYRAYRIVKKDLNQIIIDKQQEVVDSLNSLIEISNQRLIQINEQLDSKIQDTEKKADSQIAELDSSVEKNRLYWIIATLATLFLGGLIYWLLGKRISSSKTDVEAQIRNTKASLEEESVKLDNKLVEVLETQLKLQQETSKSKPVASNDKADHSLALKVADEIVRMQKNISKMGKDTKGLKPLLKGIERIQNNFAANGYEMINHLNKAYDERFNIDVINFITDENLEEGARIITAVIKPQVNYNDVLIQRAQVDVSQN